MSKPSETSEIPKVGDVVLVNQGIGIVRFVGDVEFDQGEEYIGIEIKGPPVPGGSNGKQNGKKYFSCLPKRGIFVKKVIRIVSNEEILDKCAHLYDIVQGRKGFNSHRNQHFIDRQTYDNLLDNYNLLKVQYESLDKSINEYDKMVLEYAILREKIGLMKDNYNAKINENAVLNDKIMKAERKLGTRLSKMDMTDIMNKLNSEFGGSFIGNENNDDNDDNKEYKVPDYGQIYGTNGDNNVNNIQDNNNGVQKKGHKKRDSIDQSNGIVDKMEESATATPSTTIKQDSTTHFRKFSSTTKMAMIANEMKKSASAETKPNGVERGSLGKKAPKKSRGSVTISNDDAQVIAEVNENNDDDDDDDDDDIPSHKNSRRGRESTTIDNFEPQYDDYDPNNNNNDDSDYVGNGNGSNNNNDTNKPRKARGSQIMDIDQNALTNDDYNNNLNNVFGDVKPSNSSHQPQLSTTPELAQKGPKHIIGNTNDDDDDE